MTDKLVLFTFVVLLATGFYFGRSPISVGAGYSAKVMCSEVFTSGWTPAFAEQQETKSMLVPIYSTTFDKDSVTVSTLFGFITRTAYVNKNGGCTLLPEGKTERHYFDLPQQTSTEEDQTKNWPEGGKDAVTNEDKNVNYSELNTLLDAAFHEPVVDAVGIYRRTRAVVIVHDGKIIGERYAPNFSPATRFSGWSMTKSLFSSLIGQRISEGKLSLQQNNLFKEWENDARRNITIGDLLNASSGLAFKEGNGPAEDTANLLFNSESVVASALSHKATSDKKWAYSSADANLLGAALRKSFEGDDKLYWSYPQKFFSKININSAVLDTDYQGDFVPSSYSHLTARDWARYGLFALQKGKWLNSQVLPTNWFDYAFTPAPTAPNGEYGAQWWLNRGSKDGNRRFPTLPADAIFANGFEDQSIAIFPSHKLVVVRLGGTSPSYAWNVENFLGYLLENVIRN